MNAELIVLILAMSMPSWMIEACPISQTNIVAEGDSLTAGSGAPQWPSVLGAMARWRTATVVNLAVSGSITTNVLDRWGLAVPFMPANNSTLTWYIVWIGHNNIDYLYEPFYLTEPDLATIWRNGRNAGAKVMAVTVHKSVQMTVGKEIERQVLNTWIRQNGQMYDALCDIDAAFAAAYGEDYYTNTTVFSDGIHTTTAGSALVAANIDRCIPSATLPPAWEYPNGSKVYVSSRNTSTPDSGWTAAGGIAFALNRVGLGTSTPSTLLEISDSENQNVQVSIINGNSLSSAGAGIALTADSGMASYLVCYSSGVGAYGPYQPNGTLLTGAGTGGLNLCASYSSAGLGIIRFFTGGEETEKMILDSPGNLSVAGAIIPANGVILTPSAAPPLSSIPVARLFFDGTSLCVVLQTSAGEKSTNRVSMTAYP